MLLRSLLTFPAATSTWSTPLRGIEDVHQDVCRIATSVLSRSVMRVACLGESCGAVNRTKMLIKTSWFELCGHEIRG